MTVDLIGSQGIGINKRLAQDVAAAEKQLALHFGKLVLVVSRLVIKARGDVALGCLYRWSSVLGVAIYEHKDSGFATPHDLGALLGTRVDISLWSVSFSIPEARVAPRWFPHLESGDYFISWPTIKAKKMIELGTTFRSASDTWISPFLREKQKKETEFSDCICN